MTNNADQTAEAVERIQKARNEGAKVLSLQFLNLGTLPSEIGNLTKLQDLWLDGNQLKSLPSEIGNLTSLQNLSLGKNQLKSLPSEIGNLT